MKKKAFAWLVGIVLLVGICGCQQEITNDIKKAEPKTLPMKEQASITKYEPLAAWYGFQNCIQKNDFVQAFSFLCDDWDSTKQLEMTKDSVDALLYNTAEIQLIQGGINIEFGDVVLDEPDRFIINGVFGFADEQALKEWIMMYGNEQRKTQMEKLNEEELSEYFTMAKRPQEFRFRKLGQKWYYLPNGW